MEVVRLSQKKLYQLAKSLVFRKRMARTLNELEDEIRFSLLTEGKEETVAGGFRISIKEDGQILITELPPMNLEQLELPLPSQSEQSHKGGAEP